MVTRGEDVSIVSYDAEKTTLTATASQTAFTVSTAAVETNVKYSRAYVDGVEVTIASVSGTTVTLASGVAAGAIVEIFVPITKNGAYRLAQAINWGAVSNNQVIPELGTKAETEQTLSTKVGLTLAWVADDNHDLLEKLIANKTADMPMVIAWKQTNTSPTSHILFLETKVDDFGSGATAGGLATITCSLVSKWPVVVKTS